MNIEKCVDSLSMPLPEDIMKRKWAGDFDGALAAIDVRLAGEMPDMLRARLVCEKERIRRLPTQYPWDRKTAVEKLRTLVPDVTEAEFDLWELQGRIDFIYVKGEKRYFVRFHRSLAKQPDVMPRTENGLHQENAWLDPMIAEIREKASLTRRITLKTSVYVDADAFVPGEYLVHLPFPAGAAQQSGIELLAGDPDGIGSETAQARTAWWRRRLDAPQTFCLTYRYVSCIRYADPLHAPAPETPLYPGALPPCAEDLAESGAYLRFTPYLRDLAARLTAGETDPAKKAWRIYEFVTTEIAYSFMRDYFQIDGLNEYCALNGRGDCGLQALLFIVLCRISGIPARWQSGLSISEDYVGSHDWAQFWLPGWGWLFADPSFGGSAYRCGAQVRHEFYFGNIDPMRMAANRAFQASLEPEMHALRVDPYDNQSGEVERIGAEKPFTMRQLDGDADLIGCETL